MSGEDALIFVGLLLGFIFGVVVGFALSEHRNRLIAEELAVMNARWASINQRLGNWIQRTPTEKSLTDETFSNDEIPTKDEILKRK